ncbi:MAG: GDSL-type esterase/lipase family protein, partial [Victivallaceae bacterium]
LPNLKAGSISCDKPFTLKVNATVAHLRLQLAEHECAIVTIKADGMHMSPSSGSDKTRLPLAGKRMAFIGDSITDGHTMPILFEQSLKASGIMPPICTNVAVAGNRASDMLARLDRDVIPFHADFVALSAGVNDANNGITPEQYGKDITDIVDMLSADGSQVIILTPTPITSPKAAEVKPRWAEYTIFLRNLAAQRKLRLVECDRRMEEAIADGQSVMGGDGVHIDFPGYRVMTRALLDALGYSNVPVVEKMQLTIMPGVISLWKTRRAPTDIPLAESDVSSINPDADWKKLSLPEESSAAEPGGWWLEQERQRGFVVGLDLVAGKAKRYQCVAEVASSKERQAYLNTGGTLETIWLNGKKVYQTPGNSGWHPGKERIQVTFKSGTNQILVETASRFFLSITDDNKW